MDFLDTYDVSGTRTPPHSTVPEQNLNEEVTQVIGQLGRFWGGFRQQSQSAFGEVVSQAQREISKLTNEAPKESTSENTSSLDDAEQTGSASDADHTRSTSTPSVNLPPSSTSSLFARLQSALPPSIVSTVQNNIPETLKHASENLDLAQLQTTLSNEFQRVQGVTRAHAEEYVHKSEGMLREAMKEVGEVLRDAVKVIPPDDGGPMGSAPGFVWDGTDMWMLPTPVNELSEVGGNGKGKGKDSGASSGRAAQRAVATRAESLLKRLKRDPEIIKHDPEADEGVRALYNTWLQTEVDVKEGGIVGDEWTAKASSVLDEPGEGKALQANHDTLVPSEMTKEVFWKRYFFRVYQIEREERKRKALLEGSIESEEVFSWEDDDEDPSSHDGSAKSTAFVQETAQNPASLDTAQSHPTSNTACISSETLTDAAPHSQTQTPANTSPRESSESGESYDLVPSENASGEGKTKKGEADDGDSDWE